MTSGDHGLRLRVIDEAPLGKLAAASFATGALIFIPAATVRWWNAWLLLCASAVVGIAAMRLFARSPELAEERRTAGPKAKRWDRVLVPLVSGVLPVAMLVAAGLDRRFGRTGEGVAVPLAALAVLAAGAALAYRAMAVNPFCSSHVRIQRDRGHTVVHDGPYAVVRHPGYAGAIVFNLAAPLVLGSRSAAFAGVAIALLIVVRTALEDRTLRRELEGYAAYAAQVRWRLVPFVW